jgi:hypothetical protein
MTQGAPAKRIRRGGVKRADRTDIMENTATPSKGFNWFKLLGILALIGVLVAVGRIVLRVFREKPDTDTDSHEAG